MCSIVKPAAEGANVESPQSLTDTSLIVADSDCSTLCCCPNGMSNHYPLGRLVELLRVSKITLPRYLGPREYAPNYLWVPRVDSRRNNRYRLPRRASGVGLGCLACNRIEVRGEVFHCSSKSDGRIPSFTGGWTERKLLLTATEANFIFFGGNCGQ